jgi:hypothetical protein
MKTQQIPRIVYFLCHYTKDDQIFTCTYSATLAMFRYMVQLICIVPRVLQNGLQYIFKGFRNYM